MLLAESDLLPVLAGVVLFNVLLSVIVSRAISGGIKTKHDKELKKLQTTLSVLSSGSLGMGQRMIALEQKINALQNNQEELKQSNVDFSYTQAQRLIEQGIDSHTIAMNSGLSSSEIQLMQLLHNSGKEKSAARVSFG